MDARHGRDRFEAHGDRRAARAQGVLLAWTLLLALASGIAGCGDRSSQAGVERSDPRATDAALLFVVQATGASIVPAGSGAAEILRLTGVAPSLLAFADRPLRVAMTQPTASLPERWAAYGFAAVPPNGALVISGRALEEPLALELRGPRYDAAAATLDFDATSLSADLAASLRSLLAASGSGCSVALFIDAAQPTPAPTPAVDDTAEFLATLSSVTGRSFSAAQQDLITRALASLLQLAHEDANLGNEQLIRNNVEAFLDNLQQVLGLTLTRDELQQLTSVLARMSGVAT
jgi:hypothetical protein